jgi:enoyl-[acyl-carrier protein] reductase III
MVEDGSSPKHSATEKLELEDQVALVTGGSRGIGRAVALELAQAGAHVAINYLRDGDSARSIGLAVKNIRRKTLLIQANVGNAEEVKDMFLQIKETFGRLDILVHSASLGVFKTLVDMTVIQLNRLVKTNSTAFIVCAQEASRLMTNGGKIIAVSSLGSQRYVTDYGSMGVAKAAVEAAVRYLAVELAPKGISVNAVAGGPVDTEGLKLFPNYEIRKHECTLLTPLGRIGKPEDIAKIVAFLCTKSSLWICGQTIIADGGLSLRLLSL